MENLRAVQMQGRCCTEDKRARVSFCFDVEINVRTLLQALLLFIFRLLPRGAPAVGALGAARRLPVEPRIIVLVIVIVIVIVIEIVIVVVIVIVIVKS